MFELERSLDRQELAALFETLASAAGGRPARVDGDDGTLAVEFPSRTFVDLDVERESDAGEATVDLELELEWEEPSDEPTVRVHESDAAARAETAADDRAQTTLPETGGDAEPESPPERAGAADEPDRTADDAGRRPRRSRFEVYRDRGGEWRWRLVHWNGNVVADGGEGYASRYNAVRAVRSVMRIAPEARVERLEP